jgi:hypothetical protein
MSGMDELRSLGVHMKQLQDRKATLEEELSVINKDLDFVRTIKIPQKMEELQLKNATFEGLGRIQLASDLYASTKEGQKGAAMQWLRDCGYEGMISETYNASSLKALLRRMLVEGVEIPDTLFSVSPFTRASIVKA